MFYIQAAYAFAPILKIVGTGEGITIEICWGFIWPCRVHRFLQLGEDTVWNCASVLSTKVQEKSKKMYRL